MISGERWLFGFWYWLHCWPSLFVDFGGIVDHHCLLILVALLTITVCWYWWHCWSSLLKLSSKWTTCVTNIAINLFECCQLTVDCF
jgi:hypothetical protein